jgi:hypothetical protein
MEEWKLIPGALEYYVSSHGRVRHGDRLLKLAVVRGGYLRASIREGGKLYSRQVHRLVLRAFSGPPPFAGSVSRHLDGNPANNTPSNLQWGTIRENTEDRLRHGTQVHGEQLHSAKITDELAANIIADLAAGLWQREIAEKYGISADIVGRVSMNKTWKHIANDRGPRKGRGHYTILHAEKAVFNAGGKPGTDKICSVCNSVKPKSEFTAAKNTLDRLRVYCRPCAAERMRQWRQKRRNAQALISEEEA